MTLTIEPQPVPLRKESDGSWRVGDTRVLLELVIQAFNAGSTPEGIIQSYDTLKLADVYSVLAYYLMHKAEVDGYIEWADTEGDKMMEKVRALTDHEEFRERLSARIAAREPSRPG
jgi:uncharacterized protein (DUF433 family)